MKKKTLILICLGVLAITLGFLFSQKKTASQSVTPPSVVKESAPPPAVSLVSNEPNNVIFSFAGTSESFPSSLPLYSYVWPQTETTKTSGSFGFSNNPIKKSSGSQSLTLWSNDTKELSLYSDGGVNNWSYVLKTPSSTDIKAASQVETKGLIEKLISPPAIGTLSFTKEIAGPFDGFITTESPQPTFHGFDFSFLIDNKYPLVGFAFNESAASAILDQNNFIRSLSFSLIPTTQKENQSKNILTIQEAVISLNKNRGKLISAGRSDESVFWGENPSFKSVTLTTVKIIYYPDEDTMLLTPFFFFTGKATNQDGVLLDVEYAVSAIE